MRFRTICRAVALATALTMASLDATAGVTYQVVDLVDPDGAPDTRRIDYRIDDPVPNLFGYTLYFDSALFADLQTLSFDTDRFFTETQPVPEFSLDGLIDMLALADLPAGAGFSVQFTWLGSGATGAQAYSMYDESFNVIGNGQTRLATPTPEPVPEPASAALLVAGLAAMARQRHRRQHSR